MWRMLVLERYIPFPYFASPPPKRRRRRAKLAMGGVDCLESFEWQDLKSNMAFKSQTLNLQ